MRQCRLEVPSLTQSRPVSAMRAAMMGVTLLLVMAACAIPVQHSAPRPIGRYPNDIIAGPDGNLWFTERQHIGRITPDGHLTEFAVPWDLCVNVTTGPDGNLWFICDKLSFGPYVIGRLTPGGDLTGSFPLGGASSIVTGPDGNLWATLAAGESSSIARITPRGVITTFPLPAGVSSGSIAAGGDGKLWFTERRARIGSITMGGVITEFSIPTPDARSAGILQGPDGNLWFTEEGNSTIGRITPSGAITEFSGRTAGSGNPENGVSIGTATVGPDGNLWFVQVGQRLVITRMTMAGAVSEVARLKSVEISALTTGPDGNLWFTDAPANKIGRFTLDGKITEYALPFEQPPTD